jgi:malonate-semialdehyde dehydrogenase (acetylating)/methylmalonate-semialdehyde dehydrogenase
VTVGDEVADALVLALQSKIAEMKVGSATDNNNDMGPLINAPHRDRVVAAIDTAVAQGAVLCGDGRGLLVVGFENGNFVGATLFDRVTPEMDIYQTEVFGPVLAVVRVANLAQALTLINDHEYGNGTCIFTRDGEAARFFSDNVLVGMVGVNIPLPVPVAHHSFGGWKASLFGDLHAYGPDSIRFYTKRKTITQRWPSSDNSGSLSYSFPSY